MGVQRLAAPSTAGPARAASLVPGPPAPTRPVAAASVVAPSETGLAIQRAVAIEELSSQVGGGAGADAGGGSRGAVAGAGLADATDGDLDLLARRLYGRIRESLRGELLLDRERSGSLADF
jgi:hypothetical protein